MTRPALLKFLSFHQVSNWNIKQLFNRPLQSAAYPSYPLGNAPVRRKEVVWVEDTNRYMRITIRTNCGGVVVRDRPLGKTVKTKQQYRIHAGQLAVSKIDARNGAFGLVPEEAEGAIITGNFWVYDVLPQTAMPEYLVRLLASPRFVQIWEECSNGSGNRLYLQEPQFLHYPVPFPPLVVQERLVENFQLTEQEARTLEERADTLEQLLEQELFKDLGVVAETESSPTDGSLLRIARFCDMTQWGYDKVEGRFPFQFIGPAPVSLKQVPQLCLALFRGKSPRYDPKGDRVILNQKCNRKNEIDLRYAKTVDSAWLERISQKQFTAPGDLLINSTGEGTLGRASMVDHAHAGLFLDSHLLLLRPNCRRLDPRFFAYLFNTTLVQRQVEQLKGAQATKQTELGIENVRRIQFPLPSLERQQELGARAEQRAQLARRLRLQASQLRQKAQEAFEREVFGQP